VTPTAIAQTELSAAAEQIAAGLVDPPPITADRPWAGSWLSGGHAGIALLHVERAHAGTGSWGTAQSWIRAATAPPASGSDDASLFLGAPAIAFMLHTTGRGRYQSTADQLAPHIAAIAHRRAAAGRRRIAAAALGTFAEYDVFRGLAGIGAVLLATDPAGSALGHVLEYLVELTRPLRIGDLTVPGWWVSHDQHMTAGTGPFAAGHANLGAAHGIAGPLALLALAARHGAVVEGQTEAIDIITSFLHRWRQDGPGGWWWPETITTDELAVGQPAHRGPFRPSWCYGTPGIARAGQLAAIATADTSGQDQFENALDQCLTDPDQRARINDAGLCHGAAGLFQTAWRTAADARTPNLRRHLPGLADDLQRLATKQHGPGLVNGQAGAALALQTAATSHAPEGGWDKCLLIS
jgi:lantibiotic biosynthesis protein